MARLFIDGFETGDFGLWDEFNDASVVAAPSGMEGNFAARFTTTSSRMVVDFPAEPPEVYLAFRFRPSTGFNNPGGNSVLAFRKWGYEQAKLCVNASGRLVGYRGGTVLGTGTTTLVADTTYRIEVRFKPHDTSGVFQVKVDGGALQIDFSGDTIESTSAGGGVKEIAFGALAVWSTQGYFDNVVVDAAGWVGDTHVVAIAPNGVGASSQWTPSTGSNYACVDEAPPSDSDYVTTNVLNQKDLYAMSDLPGAASSVRAVVVSARIRREGSAAPSNAVFVIRSGVYEYSTLTVEVPTERNRYPSYIFEENPAAATGFTPAEVNALQLGLKAVA